MEVRLSTPLSERMLELGRVGAGQRVLDVATGRGEPAIRAAHRVGSHGSVLGIDVDASMLAMADERARAEGVGNLELRVADANTVELPASTFDAVLARWCLMYLDAPRHAMRSIRDALVDDGVFVAAVWAEPERVPYMTLPRRVLSRWCDVPAFDLEAPGVFYYADVDRLRTDVAAAGMRVVAIEDLDVPLVHAADDAELIAWVSAFSGLSKWLAPMAAAQRRAWEDAVVHEVKAADPAGERRLGGVTHLVAAVRDEGS